MGSKDSYTSEDVLGFFCLGLFVAVLFMALIGVLASPYQQLGTDRNILARNYIISQYPEYKDCAIEFSNGKYYGKNGGAKVHCDSAPVARDGLKVRGTDEGETFIISFDMVSLNGLAVEAIENYNWSAKK